MPHRPAVGCGVAGPAQIVGKPPLPRRQERQEGQRQRDQQTKTADNQEDCAATRSLPSHAARTTELGLDQRRDRPEQPAREHQPDREGGRAQEHALGDQHSREVTPLGAERGADRDFFWRRIVRSTISTARFAHTTTSTRLAATVTPSRIGCNCPTYRRWTDSSLTPLHLCQPGRHGIRAACVMRRSAYSRRHAFAQADHVGAPGGQERHQQVHPSLTIPAEIELR